MGIVRTVCGDIDSSKLGFTMAHEHVFMNFGGPRGSETDWSLWRWDEQLDMVKDYAAIGGGCLIDAAPRKVDGRDPVRLKAVSEITGVHIVASTGVPFDRPNGRKDTATNYEPDSILALAFKDKSIDDVADFYVSEIEEGMDGTSIKAGWIKSGTCKYVSHTKGEEIALRAACRASMRTGAPVHTHTTNGGYAWEQLEIVLDEGLPASQFGIAHIDRNPDYLYHKHILETGAYLIYDGPGKIKYWPDSVRIDLLRRLIADGFGKQIMLSNDMGKKSYHRQYGGGPGLGWIKTKFIPRLLAEGFTQEQCDDLMYNNPARFYSLREKCTPKNTGKDIISPDAL